MIPRCSVFIATSLDGYIAREDGSIDWLNRMDERIPSGEDCGYGAFIATVDALVMGRKSFDTVLAFGTWPYGEMPVVVLSRSLDALPAGVRATVSLERGEPREVAERLGRRGYRHLYIDGGETIREFLRAGLIDEITVTTIPVLLGSGRPLFGPVSADVPLELIDSRAYPFGFVQHRYRVLAREGGET